MANWNLPTITSGYLDFVTEMNDKFVDAGTIGYGAPTNLPNHAMRYNRSTNIFEEWDLTLWNGKVLSVLGGGTGGNTPADARTSLGLGSMATQNSNSVNITGGSITGVNLDANSITSGILALARGGTGASLALGGVGTVLLSNGTQVVFDSGVNISQINANNIVSGTVPPARLPANIAYLDVVQTFTAYQQFTGYVVFNGPGGVYSPIIQGVNPILNFYDNAQQANSRFLRIEANSATFIMRSMNDNYTSKNIFAQFTQNGLVLGLSGETYIYANGSTLTNLNGSTITTGTVPAARLGSGAANTGTFLRGDNTWQAIDAGAIPSGMIGMFATGCPVGWTRVAGLDNRFPLGSTGAGATGGASAHSHSFDQQSDPNGGHGHGFSGSVSGQTGQNNDYQNQYAVANGQLALVSGNHTHSFSAGFSGNTDTVGNHDHRVRGTTTTVDQYPPYFTVVFCQKN